MKGFIPATLLCLVLQGAAGCASERLPESARTQPPGGAIPEDSFTAWRQAMVQHQIRARGVRDPEVLRAMGEVARHRFVPPAERHLAYSDHPLEIGHGQTISQPYIVAYMTQAAEVDADDRVLEIGTGSGYQAAVLGELARQVYTIEIVPELAAQAQATLGDLGYSNVQVRHGNGYLGWPDQAPFDVIMVTAAPEEVPQTLVNQLALGGRMVIPVGVGLQEILIIEKTPQGVVERRTIPVRFVPMTGKPRP